MSINVSILSSTSLLEQIIVAHCTVVWPRLLFALAGVELLGADGGTHGGLIFAGTQVELDGDGVVVFGEGFDGVSVIIGFRVLFEIHYLAGLEVVVGNGMDFL